jgi:hypothetical protein
LPGPAKYRDQVSGTIAASKSIRSGGVVIMPKPPRLVSVILVVAALTGLAAPAAHAVAGAGRASVPISQEGIGWD